MLEYRYMNSNKYLTPNVLRNSKNRHILTITRYRKSRYWAVYAGAELLAVVLYRKGAEAIVDFITQTTIR